MASIRELSPDLAQKAKEELNEVSERIVEDIQALREWILKQRHLTARTDDQFLIAFLRGCKFSLERAKEKVDTYYTIRGAIPEFFSNRDPLDPTLSKIIDRGLCLPMPIVDQNNSSRIFLIKQGDYDPSEILVMDVLKVSYMISDISLWDDDYTVVAGQTILVDMKGLSFSHLKQISPTLIKKMTSSIQDAYPIRQKGMHFVNPTTGFDTVFKIFFNFMTEKMKKRIFVHSTLDDLHKHVPKSSLPTEYGGDLGPISKIRDDWKQKLETKRDWFKEDDSFKADEKKRVGRSKNADLLFGVEGSFRSLEID